MTFNSVIAFKLSKIVKTCSHEFNKFPSISISLTHLKIALKESILSIELILQYAKDTFGRRSISLKNKFKNYNIILFLLKQPA